MICSHCHSEDCRRSRRRTAVDYFVGVAGFLPWRCLSCHIRFHGRVIPMRYLLYARCGMCGNLELQRIAPEKVPGTSSVLGRILHLPSLRCEPCRNKFFTLRPLLRPERVSSAAVEDHAAKS